ncbi:MAG: hypothetical protein VXX46_05380 [Bacteroidota bacterium]|nr:hypothetical protein [Bacteroidota bacterium]
MNVLNRWLKYVLLVGAVAGCGSKNQVLNTSKNPMPVYTKLNHTVKSALHQGDTIEKENAQIFLGNMRKQYESYPPKDEVMESLSLFLGNNVTSLKVEVWGGNWCPDTHVGVPALSKVLDVLSVEPANFTYHRVNRDKNKIDGKNIENVFGAVPTVRFELNGKLLGEVVEFPTKSWEEDIMNFLEKAVF